MIIILTITLAMVGAAVVLQGIVINKQANRIAAMGDGLAKVINAHVDLRIEFERHECGRPEGAAIQRKWYG